MSGEPVSEPQNALTSGSAYNPPFALAPGLAPAINGLWLTTSHWVLGTTGYRSATEPSAIDDPNAAAFDIGGYDPLWDDIKFTEIAAYGGLERDAQRVAGMEALYGSDSTMGAIPYGHLTVQREFREGQYHLTLDAYGMYASVRPTAISGFGDDSYSDKAVGATWQWMAHPERDVSSAISAYALILHEDQNLIASHAIFGTRSANDLTIFRGGVNYSWGIAVSPGIQYFQVTGSSDPVRLGTLDGSPDSKGWIVELAYPPRRSADSPSNTFNVRLALQFVAYSQFDGVTHDASASNAVLLHLSTGGDTFP